MLVTVRERSIVFIGSKEMAQQFKSMVCTCKGLGFDSQQPQSSIQLRVTQSQWGEGGSDTLSRAPGMLYKHPSKHPHKHTTNNLIKTNWGSILITDSAPAPGGRSLCLGRYGGGEERPAGTAFINSFPLETRSVAECDHFNLSRSCSVSFYIFITSRHRGTLQMPEWEEIRCWQIEKLSRMWRGRRPAAFYPGHPRGCWGHWGCVVIYLFSFLLVFSSFWNKWKDSTHSQFLPEVLPDKPIL